MIKRNLLHVMALLLLAVNSHPRAFVLGDDRVLASTFEEFYAALTLGEASNIVVNKAIKMNTTVWTDVVNITKSVLITSADEVAPVMLDFTGITRLLHILPNVKISFVRVQLNGTVAWEASESFGYIGQILFFSPEAVIRIADSVIYAVDCPPMASSNSLQSMVQLYPRNPPCAPTPQQVSVGRYCSLTTCYSNAWSHTDFCVTPPIQKKSYGKAFGNTVFMVNTYLACDSMDHYPCTPAACNGSVAQGSSGSSTAAASAPALSKSTPQKSSGGKGTEDWIIPVAVTVPLLAVLAGLAFLFRHRLHNCYTGGKQGGKDQHPDSHIPLTSQPLSSTGPPPPSAPPSSGGRSIVLDANKSSVSDDAVELGGLLGRGSFGAVYRGFWRGQEVAIKVLQHGDWTLDRIQNEAHLNTYLRHPNVAGAINVLYKNLRNADTSSYMLDSIKSSDMEAVSDQTPGNYLTPASHVDGDIMETWIIMELCNLGSLDNMIASKAFFDSGVPKLHMMLLRLRDVARGLEYIHGKNICHGDLKAGNVLLATDDTDPFKTIAKVADFGLSRVLMTTQTHKSTRTMGTPSHMAPELLLRGQLSPAGDIYSFGVMAFEVATGRPAFPGMAIGELIHRVVLNKYRPKLPAYLPTPLTQLITSCWSDNRKQRPSFTEVVAAIDAMLHDVQHLQQETQEAQKVAEPEEEEPAYSPGSGYDLSSTGNIQDPLVSGSAALAASFAGVHVFSQPGTSAGNNVWESSSTSNPHNGLSTATVLSAVSADAVMHVSSPMPLDCTSKPHLLGARTPLNVNSLSSPGNLVVRSVAPVVVGPSLPPIGVAPKRRPASYTGGVRDNNSSTQDVLSALNLTSALASSVDSPCSPDVTHVMSGAKGLSPSHKSGFNPFTAPTPASALEPTGRAGSTSSVVSPVVSPVGRLASSTSSVGIGASGRGSVGPGGSSTSTAGTGSSPLGRAAATGADAVQAAAPVRGPAAAASTADHVVIQM